MPASSPGFLKKNKSLTDFLLEKGKISPEQAEQVKLEYLKTGEFEESVLKKKRVVSELDLAQAKAEFLGVPFVDLESVGFSPQALSFVPRGVAEKYNIIPYGFEPKTKTLLVAMLNPIDLETIEFLEKKSGLLIVPALSLEKQIKEAIDSRYQQELTSQVTKALKETEKKKKTTDLTDISKVIKEAPIAKIVSTILEFAMKSRSSDVHIEPREENTRVRYRIDGILFEKLLLPRNVHEAVVSRIKILADLKIDEKRVPQDGRFNFSADGNEVDLRVSTTPTVFGEKVVMRLLQKSQKIPTLMELGLRGRALRNLSEVVKKPNGIVVVTGPTGSGKTTTLYSILHIISRVQVNVMTIEDPVEYQMKEVNQVQVNTQAGLTFASALRSFLRQDPDIMMVGEIRDAETTSLAINASLTGHLVLSTLHTNSAAGCPPRMLDLGAEPFLLVSSLACVVGQRVLRKICTNCIEEYEPEAGVMEDVSRVLGDLYGLVEEKWKKEGRKMLLKRGKGCDSCNGTGYKGRVGIFEVMPISEKISRLVVGKSSSRDIEEAAVEEGMVTMIQDGYIKALEGLTTIEEVLRVAQD
jgi:type IV pilus assembly protein PilB